MVVRAEVRVAEIAGGIREREQIVERALLALERDQWEVDAEFHRGTAREPIDGMRSTRSPQPVVSL